MSEFPSDSELAKRVGNREVCRELYASQICFQGGHWVSQEALAIGWGPLKLVDKYSEC